MGRLTDSCALASLHPQEWDRSFGGRGRKAGSPTQFISNHMHLNCAYELVIYPVWSGMRESPSWEWPNELSHQVRQTLLMHLGPAQAFLVTACLWWPLCAQVLLHFWEAFSPGVCCSTREHCQLAKRSLWHTLVKSLGCRGKLNNAREAVIMLCAFSRERFLYSWISLFPPLNLERDNLMA